MSSQTKSIETKELKLDQTHEYIVSVRWQEMDPNQHVNNIVFSVISTRHGCVP